MKKSNFEIEIKPEEAILRVSGKKLEDLFIAASQGLASIMTKGKKTKKADISSSIKVSSTDVNGLLASFLGEIMYKGEVERAVFSQVEIKKFSNLSVEANILGSSTAAIEVLPKKIEQDQLNILKGPKNLWQAELTFIF